MNPTTRYLVDVLVIALALSGGNLSAQAFPSKPIRWIVPFPAGGTGDIVVRNLSGPMSKSMGQQVIADFRPGAFTIIGTELAARAPADGYTLLFVSNGFVTNRAVRTKLPYDSLRDFVGVARIVTTPFIMVVHPSVPAKSLKELLALARARPGDLTYGTISMGGAMHIAREMLSQSAKVSFNPVHYQGIAPLMIAVVGGHVSIALTNVPDVVPYVEAGRLRPIAVTSASRSPAMKDVPTIIESGFPEIDFQLWIGAAMVRAAPREAVNRLSAEITSALEQSEVKAAFDKLGLVPAPLNPEQFDAFLRVEAERSEKVARRANIRIE